MKLIKMRINRIEGGGGTHYEYPPQYNAELVKFGPIYESGLDENASKVRERAKNDEYIIIGVEDNAAENFLSSNKHQENGFEFEAKEITKEEALSDGNSWTKQSDEITDQSVVIKILAKVARNEPLTQKEKDAIDPDKPELGINKSRSFEEDLNEFLAR